MKVAMQDDPGAALWMEIDEVVSRVSGLAAILYEMGAQEGEVSSEAVASCGLFATDIKAELARIVKRAQAVEPKAGRAAA